MFLKKIIIKRILLIFSPFLNRKHTYIHAHGDMHTESQDGDKRLIFNFYCELDRKESSHLQCNTRFHTESYN